MAAYDYCFHALAYNTCCSIKHEVFKLTKASAKVNPSSNEDFHLQYIIIHVFWQPLLMAFQCQLFIQTLLVMHVKRDFLNEETFTLAIFLAKTSAILWCNYTILLTLGKEY